MSNNRDEQSQGFAMAVLDKMLSNKDGVMDPSDWWKEQAMLILARAAYDLVCDVPPSSRRRLLLPCESGARPAQQLLLSQVEDDLRRSRIPVEFAPACARVPTLFQGLLVNGPAIRTNLTGILGRDFEERTTSTCSLVRTHAHKLTPTYLLEKWNQGHAVRFLDYADVEQQRERLGQNMFYYGLGFLLGFIDQGLRPMDMEACQP